jgi:hypothetical protein
VILTAAEPQPRTSESATTGAKPWFNFEHLHRRLRATDVRSDVKLLQFDIAEPSARNAERPRIGEGCPQATSPLN